MPPDRPTGGAYVDLDRARAFLGDHHRAVLHTYREDGSPQLSPILVAVDDDGLAIVSTRETSVKVANLERDPRASLCVFTDDFFGPWTRIDGTTEVVPLPDALEPLIAYYRRVAGEHDDWDRYRQSMREERRVLLRITLTEAGPDVAG
jgi:PPOX class probable F420-dependent enzyme